jgi:hypothetical protein
VVDFTCWIHHSFNVLKIVLGLSWGRGFFLFSCGHVGHLIEVKLGHLQAVVSVDRLRLAQEVKETVVDDAHEPQLIRLIELI